MTDAPDFLLALYTSRLPIVGDRFVFELVQFDTFSWSEGLVGTLRLTFSDPQGAMEMMQEGQVALLRGEDLAVDLRVVEAALDAWRARVAGLSHDAAEAEGLPGLAPWAEADADELEARYQAWIAASCPETAEDAQARRQAALDQALAAFGRLADHVQAVWGLTLPRTLAVYHAFHLVLQDLPPEVRDASETHPGGVLDRLDPGGWERVVPPDLDERVHTRFRRDPPEMLTFAWGNSDGQHFGLWYDAADAPAGVVHNYARDSAETWWVGPHPLSVCRHRWAYDAPPDDETGFAARRFLDELAWFEAEEAKVAIAPTGRPLDRRPALLGGPGALPGTVLPGDISSRQKIYRTNPAKVRAWMADALSELRAGRPERALSLGRELHWVDRDEHREAAGALLQEAYEALGRHAHAGILRAHLRLRDLPNVGVLCDPPA